MLPVTCAQVVELKLHIIYRAGIFRPVSLQKLTLLSQIGQANYQELMSILEEKEQWMIRLNASKKSNAFEHVSF